MSRKTKLWLLAATLLILLGLAIFAGAMSALNWDFAKLSTDSYDTKVYIITEDFTNISISDTTANISFVPLVDGDAIVTLREETTGEHTVTVTNGTLLIENVTEKKWYQHIGIHFETPTITIAIPQKQYSALSVKVTTGNITVEDISLETLSLSITTGSITLSNVTCRGEADLHVSTGKVNLSDLACRDLISDGVTGDIRLENVIAESMISIERTTGDVFFDRCDAGDLLIKTNTGSVSGSLLTGKIFITTSATGNIEIPQSIPNGICNITTTTGDIRITIE